MTVDLDDAAPSERLPEDKKTRQPDNPDIEKVDNAFRSLLEGLRTTLPGVQVMLAFLLVLPVQADFTALESAQRGLYLVALLTAALGTVLLVAPSAHQRVRALQRPHGPDAGVARRHASHLRVAVWTTVVGTALASVAIASAVALATSFLLGTTGGAVVGLVVLLASLWTWFWMPAIGFDD